ncbi:MAG TPA: S8 family peptidase, partial [Planctomycetota bacterium]|nr:S8 family peptidase [Planctomycetota bacterium]
RQPPAVRPSAAATTEPRADGAGVRAAAVPTDVHQVAANAAPAAATALPADLQARYRQVEQVDVQEGAPDAQGQFTRTRLLRTTMKYPLLRVDERWQAAKPQAGGAPTPSTLISRLEMVADHLVVRAAVGRTRADVEQILQPLGAQVRDASTTTGLLLVSFPAQPAATLSRIQAALAAEPTVALVEPDFVVHTSVVPNDPSFAQQWALNNTGQSSGTPDADIDAPEAWALHTGSRTVKVAVIDTGIDLTHPDLVPNLWTNPGEIPGNNRDDDGNGYVDDVAGWNAYGLNGRPMDDNLHGTHVAGTIGAVGNNTVGVTGVCWQVTLVPVKFLDSYGSGFTSDAVDAITYATRIGVQVMSNSWGGGGASQAVRDAIMAANARGIIFVAAAGNNASSNDEQPTYPASYDCPNIIAVAASDRLDHLAYFSNYGRLSVPIAAPGRAILSTLPVIATPTMTYEQLPTSYGSLSGTSMATPHVSGAVALLKSYLPSLTATQLKARLLQRADHVPALYGKVTNAARVNLFRTLDPAWAPAPATMILAQTQISDVEGNNDSLLAPGEIVRVVPVIANIGDTAATGITVTLSVSSGATVLSTTPEPLSTIAPGSNAQPVNPLRLRLATTMTNDQIIPCTLTMRWNTGQQTIVTVPLTVTVLQPLVKTLLSFHAGESIADLIRNVVYVYDLTNPGVRGIDTGSGRTTVRRSLVATAAQASEGRLAISPDGLRLYASVPALGRIDKLALPGLTLTRSVTLPFYPGEFVVGANGRLYVGSYDNYDVLREVDAVSGAVIASLSRVKSPDPLAT